MSTFLPSLKRSGHLDRVYITICNIGSRKISELDDYASQGWEIFAPNLTIYGFDADADACDAANAEIQNRQANWIERHIPLALSRSVGESTLYVTNHPMCSSLYAPNENFLQRFSGLSDVMNLDFTIEVETTTLDEFCRQEAIDQVDFLQIDVQGADLHVLEGASKILERSVLAVQIEVEPSHLYINQPLFSDVDTYLRTKDFTLFDLVFGRRVRARSPIMSNAHPGQILWADAFYFCDLLREDIPISRPKTPEQLFKLACIADAMLFPDFALEILEHLTVNYSNNPDYNFAENIIESLAQFPDLLAQGLTNLPIVANLKEYISADFTIPAAD